jgi:short subunit fatty acids transporter
MSSTLSKIMNEVNAEPPAVPKPDPVNTSGPWYTSITLWIVIIGLVYAIIHFMPILQDYLSRPEKIIEEEVKEKVDALKEKTKKRILNDHLEEREAQALEESGFCYIGTDRGIRSCIRVNPGDKCMSGQIFPRSDICVNPSLRL